MGDNVKYTLAIVVTGTLALCVHSIQVVAYNTDKTCADFTYQEDAQEYYDDGGGRPTSDYFGMDQDGDGIACETLPPRPSDNGALSGFLWIASGGAIIGIAGIAVFISRSRNRTITQPVVADPLSSSTTVAPAQHAPVVVNVPISVDARAEQSMHSTTRVTTSQSTTSDYERLTPEKARSMPYEAYLRTPYWQAVRRNNITRAGGRCRDCGRSDQVLQVHHLSYEYLGREDDRFLVVLCASCHERRHDIAPPPDPKMNA